MKIHGWCLNCHKVKRVRVTMPRSGRVQLGICDDCERKRDERNTQSRKP